MNIAIVISILISLVIVLFQLRSYWAVYRLVKGFPEIFPSNPSTELTRVEHDNTYRISSTWADETFASIVDGLNRYLYSNQGLTADYHLIKDNVDRKCDIVEEQIATQLPFPLYLGLIGAMINVVAGLALFVIDGGLDALFNSSANSHEAREGIKHLLVGVAAAMACSGLGILLTTLISSMLKQSKRVHDERKGFFFNWVQEQILPNVSGNETQRLQMQLAEFNEGFQDNNEQLKSTLNNFSRGVEQFTAVSHDNKEMISMLKDIDVTKMARANAKTLKALGESMDQLNEFRDGVVQLGAIFNDHKKNVKKVSDAADQMTRESDNAFRYIKENGERIASETNARFEEMLRDFGRMGEETTARLAKAYEVIADCAARQERSLEQVTAELSQMNSTKETFIAVGQQLQEQHKQLAYDLKSATLQCARASEALMGQRIEFKPDVQLMPGWLTALIASACGAIILAVLIALSMLFTGGLDHLTSIDQQPQIIVAQPDSLHAEPVEVDTPSILQPDTVGWP